MTLHRASNRATLTLRPALRQNEDLPLRGHAPQNAPNHVRRVAAPPWSLFLQLLEDVGPPWLVAALHGSSAANVITKAEMKAMLTNSDPGGTVSSGGLLAFVQAANWTDMRQLNNLFWLGHVSRADFDRALEARGKAGAVADEEVKANVTIGSRRRSWLGDYIQWVSFSRLDRAWWNRHVLGRI